MVHCWEEYLSKVHKAMPMDPWADNVQLLDVLIQDRCSPSWLPTWFRRKKSQMTRVGSLLSLGTNDSLTTSTAWKKQVALTSNGGRAAAPKVDDGASAAAAVAPPPDADADAEADTDADSHAVSNSLAIHSSSMPDIHASISTSTSLLASLTGGSSATAQFDVKGSKSITCNVSGVQSRRVDVDALLKIVTPRTASASALPEALWRPDIFLPQLSWSSKRGQTIWVVVEIMFANNIKIEADNQGQATGKAEVKATSTEETVSTQLGIKKDLLWAVLASKDNPMFPLAYRLQRLDYDAFGNLISKKNKKQLQRNGSLNPQSTKPSSKHVTQSLSRSLSAAPMLPENFRLP